MINSSFVPSLKMGFANNDIEVYNVLQVIQFIWLKYKSRLNVCMFKNYIQLIGLLQEKGKVLTLLILYQMITNEFQLHQAHPAVKINVW